jgi:hypothetical protein
MKALAAILWEDQLKKNGIQLLLWSWQPPLTSLESKRGAIKAADNERETPSSWRLKEQRSWKKERPQRCLLVLRRRFVTSYPACCRRTRAHRASAVAMAGAVVMAGGAVVALAEAGEGVRAIKLSVLCII